MNLLDAQRDRPLRPAEPTIDFTDSGEFIPTSPSRAQADTKASEPRHAIHHEESHHESYTSNARQILPHLPLPALIVSAQRATRFLMQLVQGPGRAPGPLAWS